MPYTSIGDASDTPDRGLRSFTLPEIPGYTLGDMLGKGGVGSVYLGMGNKMGLTKRQVAIKLIDCSSPGEKARAMQEIEILADLSHPYIVRIYDFGETDRGLFLVMPYFPETLESLIKKGVSQEEAISILEKLLPILEFIHKKKIIHRDIKPENILMDEEGHFFLGDFGLARHDKSPQLTQTGSSIGTPGYMSPEQVEGTRELDHRSDLFSLGVIFYRLLTQEFPFQGESKHLIMEAIHQKEPISPRQLVPSISLSIEKVCLQALAKKRENRYPSAKAWREELESLSSLGSLEDNSTLLTEKNWPGAKTIRKLPQEEQSTGVFPVKAPEEKREAVSSPQMTEKTRPQVKDHRLKAMDEQIADWEEEARKLAQVSPKNLAEGRNVEIRLGMIARRIERQEKKRQALLFSQREEDKE